MGVDYRAYAVIGCVVDLDKVTMKKERVRAFKHNYPDNGEIKFDPKTGRALWETKEYPEFVFEDDGGCTDDYSGKSKVIKLMGLKLYQGTDGEPTVLGVGTGDDTYSNGGDDKEFLPIKDLESIKNKVKAVLEPIGMWDEDTFGLYAILYCSY